MSDKAFADSARPRPSTILRIPLLPYSLGHEITLLASANLLLLPDEDFNGVEIELQVSSIIRAVSTCSRTWKQNQAADKWVKLWLWTIRNADYRLAIADFRNYRTEGSTFPRCRSKECEDSQSKGRSLGSPFLARLAAYGEKVFGERAYDMPLGQLQWMYFADMEAEGSVHVENAEEKATREQLADAMTEIEKEQAERRKEGLRQV